MHWVIVEKWRENGERKEFRKSFEAGTEAASLMDAIEQFEALCPRPKHITTIERNTHTVGGGGMAAEG